MAGKYAKEVKAYYVKAAFQPQFEMDDAMRLATELKAQMSTDQIGIFNVTFEPGCRNNWHIHHAKSGGGQILVCVAGRGFYQEEGKEAVEMNPGDCINIPAEVKHWHGAAPDEWFSHLAIEVSGVDCSNEWCEAVSEKEYGNLK